MRNKRSQDDQWNSAWSCWIWSSEKKSLLNKEASITLSLWRKKKLNKCLWKIFGVRWELAFEWWRYFSPSGPMEKASFWWRCSTTLRRWKKIVNAISCSSFFGLRSKNKLCPYSYQHLIFENSRLFRYFLKAFRLLISRINLEKKCQSHQNWLFWAR